MKTFSTVLFTIVLYVLFALALISFYDAQLQFAEIVKNPEPPWFISINLMPLTVFLLIGGLISFLFFKRSKRKHKKLASIMMIPPEFEEQDEREMMITAKACRNSYITLYIAVPIIAGLMLLYPFIQDRAPYYPIIVVLLIPVVQIMSYYFSMRKSI
ncbi:hypothetical protein [Metabacillus arenae]|uniref:Uncharacterized protein n=1 Tax=Metabacillus arenae TaxID=2771434 RepID=A0A926RUR2_9BACI|nr:hypothetical protein [Metabacillus arenae]MBD1378828.1 hypothetical protein [Metabacillus arenae]